MDMVESNKLTVSGLVGSWLLIGIRGAICGTGARSSAELNHLESRTARFKGLSLLNSALRVPLLDESIRV